MAKPPKRSFTLLDAIILMAATALGFAWVRSLFCFESYQHLTDMLPDLPTMLHPTLATWTVAIVGLRLLPPRPPLFRLVLQPGTAACGGVAFLMAIESASCFAIACARSRGFPWFIFRPDSGWSVELFANAFDRHAYPIAVAIVWSLLLLSRRCRAERSWIDRTGRAIGLLWILKELGMASDYAIQLWEEAGL